MNDQPGIQDIFADALEIASPTERASFLEKACAGNTVLRTEVDKLLALAPEVGEGFLGGTTRMPEPAESVGDRIGPYTLVQSIGEGGMGSVYLAEQAEPVRRKVALKILKAELNTRNIVARFEAERQALAMMDHPNIAKVYDAGTTPAGFPFFVMELVNGVPITNYCDSVHLPVRERLALFASVCKAIQHAHQKGVIHRDIKPNNVLVAIHDGAPVPKVIDFGIAKAIDQQLSNQPLETQLGAVIGTLEYMSPEQADLSVLGVDARADIYSLGVLLYVLLTGATPLDSTRLRKAAWSETLKTIREVEPAKPSTRIADSKEGLTPLSEQRGTEPRQLVRQVRGELDWIAMKALEKDRTRRYETAADFARDIERFLKDEPVEASPPSKAYRLQKFVQRNKIIVAASAAVAAALIAGLIVSTWMYFREREALGREVAATSEKSIALEREVAATAEKSQALAKAQAAERETKLRLCDSLNAQGDALCLAGKWIDGRASYLQSWTDLSALSETEGSASLTSQSGFLEALCRAPVPLLTFGNGKSAIQTVDISPDLKLIATGDSDGGVHLWNAQTGAEIRSLTGHKSTVTSVVFSKDGSKLLSGGLDQNAILWDVATGNQLRVFNQHHAAINGVAFSPDQRSILIGCGDRTARLLYIETGDEYYKWPHDGWVSSVAFSPNGQVAATGSMDGNVRLWNVATGDLLHTLSNGEDKVLGVKFTPDGSVVVWCGGNGKVQMGNVASGKLMYSFKGHLGGNACGLSIAPNGYSMLTAGSDTTVRGWWLDTGAGINAYAIVQRNAAFFAVAHSKDGRLFATGSADGFAHLWDVKLLSPDGPFTTVYPHVKEPVHQLLVSHDGRLLISSDTHGVLKIWDTATHMELAAYQGPPDGCVALSPDNRILAAAGSLGMIKTWNLPNLDRQEIFLAQKDVGGQKDITSLAFLPNSHRMLSGTRSGALKLWDLDSPTKRTGPMREFEGHRQDESADAITEILVDPAGKQALTLIDFEFKLWNLDESRPTKTVPLKFGAYRASLIHAGHDVVIATRGDSALELHNLDTGKLVRTLPGNTGTVNGVAVLPGERWAVSCASDGKVKIFDLNTGAELRSLMCVGEAESVAASPDGRYLFAGTKSGSIQQWDLKSPSTYLELEKQLSQAREALKRNPDDPEGLRVFGEWYAFRDVPEWAIEFLEKYRGIAGKNAAVAPLMLGRCYWKAQRYADALREFEAELAAPQAAGKSPEDMEDRARYLKLCIEAIKSGIKAPKEKP